MSGRPLTIRILRALLAITVAGALGLGGMVSWEYTNSSEFCANTCHGVHPEEPEAYRDSYHARVKCVECHMGRLPTLQGVLVKAKHTGRLWSMVTGRYERPLASKSMRPANESCERCHWPAAFHSDRLLVIKRYARDEPSTETRTHLTIRVGGGSHREGRGKGIHWHIENPVHYITTDARKQNIPWVEVTRVDGTRTVYQDLTQPLTDEQVKGATKRLMDCVDCHNRVGHPFESPDTAVDRAIALNLLDRRLPYLKARMVNLIERDFSPGQEGRPLMEAIQEAYRRGDPGILEMDLGAIHRVEALVKELRFRMKFQDPETSWRSFPDNTAHRDFPGCFRCHDGKHLDAQDHSIRLHCNICHDIPRLAQEGKPAPIVEALVRKEPASHLEPNFIRDHRFLAGDDCVGCHGDVRFGNDGESFCANRACHGRRWPTVDLDAGAPHPFALEGEHQGISCHRCHRGVRRPDADCQACHVAPPDHPVMACKTCHSPVGWLESAAAGRANAPALPHPECGLATCRHCHGPTAAHRAPESHRDYPPDGCLLCHAPASGTRPAPPDHGS